MEGYPLLGDFLSHLSRRDKKKVILKPFIIVAGNHAVNDMAGSESDSWKSLLESKGNEGIPIPEGLGSNNLLADIYVQHTCDAAKDNRLELKQLLQIIYKQYRS